ncbi:Exo-beta-1,3-glucanase [Flagelloscypha sp. PMI_526]|nr:Exo-beta-1,3-glucanase [Flagelloscypha sp. PMI_526]
MFFVSLVLSAVLLVGAQSDSKSRWPHSPWKTEGRLVKNSRGEDVTILGVNWPGSGETMIPEGLQYSSASSIISRLASEGFNFVRHTYAIEMIDQIYERNGVDVSIEEAFTTALGAANGGAILGRVLENNKDLGWTKNTTRFQVWDSLAQLEAENGILMHPDNHVSKAMWCCGHYDGNAWFGDKYFNIDQWHRGLAYMATWAKNHANIVSMSLRNELRASYNDTTLQYNWVTWASNVTAAADAIHSANSDLLITISGLQYDQDLSALTQELNLNLATSYKLDAIRDAKRREPVYLKLDDQAWKDKAVLELHMYSMSENADTGDCEAIKAQLYNYGYNALGIDPPSACGDSSKNISQYDCVPAKRLTPVWMTEFGQAEDSSLYTNLLTNCLREFTTEHKISWAVWAIAGSYYIRSGVQDLDDTWALFNHDWSNWRDPDTAENFWKPWIQAMGETGV